MFASTALADVTPSPGGSVAALSAQLDRVAQALGTSVDDLLLHAPASWGRA